MVICFGFGVWAGTALAWYAYDDRVQTHSRFWRAVNWLPFWIATVCPGRS